MTDLNKVDTSLSYCALEMVPSEHVSIESFYSQGNHSTIIEQCLRIAFRTKEVVVPFLDCFINYTMLYCHILQIFREMLLSNGVMNVLDLKCY